MAAEAAGIALSAVALLAALSTAVDGYLLLDEILDSMNEANWLRLQYQYEKHRLQCWEHEVRKTDGEGRNRLELLPPSMKMLIHSSISEIQIAHKEIEKIVTKHNVRQISSASGTPSAQVRPVTQIDKNRFQGKITWVIRDREKFQGKVDKLSKMNGFLFECLGIEATAAAARALPAFTVAASTNDLDLRFLEQHSKSQNSSTGVLVSNCASLKLLDQSISRIDVPDIPCGSIDVDHAGAHRSLALYKDGTRMQRVFVEWKNINANLGIDERESIVNRIKALATLLYQSKESDFRLPSCLGLCRDGPDRYGYVFGLPSRESDLLMGPRSLMEILETAKHNGDKALLGGRFKLAYALASSFALLQSANWVHKGFRSNNVLFFRHWDANDKIPLSEMQVAGFEYSRAAVPGERSIETQPASTDVDTVLYQHPNTNEKYRRFFDIYSLGVVLFEIALWRPLKYKFPKEKPLLSMNPWERRSYLIDSVNILGGEVGAAYRDVVRVCLTGDFDSGVFGDDSLMPRVFLIKVVSVLEACRA